MIAGRWNVHRGAVPEGSRAVERSEDPRLRGTARESPPRATRAVHPARGAGIRSKRATNVHEFNDRLRSNRATVRELTVGSRYTRCAVPAPLRGADARVARRVLVVAALTGGLRCARPPGYLLALLRSATSGGRTIAANDAVLSLIFLLASGFWFLACLFLASGFQLLASPFLLASGFWLLASLS
jgi:hypothetical protein